MTVKKQEERSPYDLVGVIPAAGTARRLGPLPCSKELLPVGFHDKANEGRCRPKVVSHYLLERMRLANMSKVYIILRAGKWDIPAYFGDGEMLNLHIAYLIMNFSFGVPYTLDQAYPFIKDSTVVFGFPDILFQPQDAFVQLLAKQAESNADVVLGLFIADQPRKMDMVELDNDGRVRGIQIKPSRTRLRYAWIIAVWTSAFTHFMHEYVLSPSRRDIKDKTGKIVPEQKELYVGNVIQAALENNMKVESTLFSKGSYMDIGTPEDLIHAVRVKAND